MQICKLHDKVLIIMVNLGSGQILYPAGDLLLHIPDSLGFLTVRKSHNFSVWDFKSDVAACQHMMLYVAMALISIN